MSTSARPPTTKSNVPLSPSRQGLRARTRQRPLRPSPPSRSAAGESYPEGFHMICTYLWQCLIHRYVATSVMLREAAANMRQRTCTMIPAAPNTSRVAKRKSNAEMFWFHMCVSSGLLLEIYISSLNHMLPTQSLETRIDRSTINTTRSSEKKTLLLQRRSGQR